MAVTDNYRFPLIDPKDKFDGAEHVNELAREIDHVMQHVEEVGKDSHYVLPPATKNRLGGVIAGDNVQVADDGTISVNVNPYVLPPASYTTLGGVIVERDGGLQLEENGTIHIDDNVIGVPPQSVTTEKIADNAITNPKLADGAVTYEKLSSSLKTVFDDATKIVEGNPDVTILNTTSKDEGVSNITAKLYTIAGFHFFEAKFDLLSNGAKYSYIIADNEASSTVYNDSRIGLPAVAGTAKNKTNGKVYPVKLATQSYGRNYVVTTASTWEQTSGSYLPAGNYEVNISALFFYDGKTRD